MVVVVAVAVATAAVATMADVVIADTEDGGIASVMRLVNVKTGNDDLTANRPLCKWSTIADDEEDDEQNGVDCGGSDTDSDDEDETADGVVGDCSVAGKSAALEKPLTDRIWLWPALMAVINCCGCDDLQPADAVVAFAAGVVSATDADAAAAADTAADAAAAATAHIRRCSSANCASCCIRARCMARRLPRYPTAAYSTSDAKTITKQVPRKTSMDLI